MHQIHRIVGVTYKLACFVCRRISYAMSQHPLLDKLNGIGEADETYFGGKAKGKRFICRHS